ncbi:hypothetical protein L3Q82_014535 [Scortum barcoo]|uniref:Uncharacterized protein n=1 Tax=Scortum barcoo TaxID=214431 RepID=A0ACB8VZ73_9TELE|nr:hypothetical protein L3Q82_014535 [Scortum barcoo]
MLVRSSAALRPVHPEVTMEALKFAAVLLLVVFVQVLGALGSPLSNEEDDGEIWTVEDWQGYPLERGITIRLADLIKRSKAQQFHGLMGRSSGKQANKQIQNCTSQPVRLGRKRNKGEMFVGLMGRRSLGGGNASPLILKKYMEEEWKSDSY